MPFYAVHTHDGLLLSDCSCALGDPVNTRKKIMISAKVVRISYKRQKQGVKAVTQWSINYGPYNIHVRI